MSDDTDVSASKSTLQPKTKQNCQGRKERERMVAETKRILGRRQRLMLTGRPTEMTPTQMRVWLSKVGAQARKVRLGSGGLEADPKREQDTRNLLTYHGRHFTGNNKILMVVKVPMAERLTLEEVGEQMMEWL